MALVEATVLAEAKTALVNDLALLADAELFGLQECKVTWTNVLMRYYMIDELDCATNQFTQAEKDCLLPKLVETLC